MTEEAFAELLRANGARVFIVGGWVRDALRHVRPHDKDYMVSGIAEADFQQLFPAAQKVGHGFPVYLVSIDGSLSEVAFARKEKKEGRGYRGFRVSYDPSVTVEEDLYRRDTTMNSMALELPGKQLIDPYHGAQDVADKVIRAVSHHFTEDPVRALRAARQAAEFGFSITEETIRYMNACRAELQHEPQERIVAELRRALQSPRPSVFFRALEQADILAVTFPELSLLIGKTQPPEYHPRAMPGSTRCRSSTVLPRGRQISPRALPRSSTTSARARRQRRWSHITMATNCAGSNSLPRGTGA